MNFAVIEYSSKTGAIWRHTPKRPNFLCDPQKEIDPTSFGCYVSAFESEHIPITALVKPNLGKRVFRKITGRWPTYNISYLKKFDVLMIVHQISDGHEVTALVQRIRTELPQIKILGVTTQPYGILKRYWEDHPDWLRDFQQYLNACHLFLTVTRSTLDEWRTMTRTPVEYIPQPYPTDYTKQWFKPRAQKNDIIFVAGRTSRDNIAKGLRAAAMLQKIFPNFAIHITRIDVPDEYFDVSGLSDARYTFQQFMPWRDHLEYLSRVALVVNTDYTQTRGRVQVDCAAVGTPSIGANSDAQADLFPSLPAWPNQEIEEIIAQGKRLIEDMDFYDEIVRTAHERLQAYSYPRTVERIQKFADSI